jgi:DNA-binding response OmpR family regulator
MVGVSRHRAATSRCGAGQGFPSGQRLGVEELMARVLVVDDEPDSVELLQEFLTGKGYEVITASNGDDALKKVKAERPHLILLDVRMPGMSGFDVLREVRQFDQEVGVIMVTGVNEEEAGRQALKAGAFDYIVKPLDLEYLERSLWYKITTMLL